MRVRLPSKVGDRSIFCGRIRSILREISFLRMVLFRIETRRDETTTLCPLNCDRADKNRLVDKDRARVSLKLASSRLLTCLPLSKLLADKAERLWKRISGPAGSVGGQKSGQLRWRAIQSSKDRQPHRTGCSFFDSDSVMVLAMVAARRPGGCKGGGNVGKGEASDIWQPGRVGKGDCHCP